MKQSILIIAILISFVACGENTSEKDNPQSKNTTSQTETTTVVKSPCDLISVDEIRTLFNIGKEFEIETRDKVLTHPTCSFKWKDETLTEERKLSSSTVSYSISQEVMIVLVSNAKDNMFDAATRVYKDGITVEGIGKKAMWGEKMHQLTFISKGYMFHVNVMTSKEEGANKKRAIELSKLLISKL